MAADKPRLLIPNLAAATADGEHTHIDVDVDVDSSGALTVLFKCRGETEALLCFDEHEWQRLKAAIARVDELKAKVEAGGAFFRLG